MMVSRSTVVLTETGSRYTPLLTTLCTAPPRPIVTTETCNIAELVATVLADSIDCIICSANNHANVVNALTPYLRWLPPILVLDDTTSPQAEFMAFTGGVTNSLDPRTVTDIAVSLPPLIESLVQESQFRGQLFALQCRQDHVMDCIDDGVIALDGFGRIEHANRAAIVSFDANGAELTRLNISDIMLGDTLPDGISWSSLVAQDMQACEMNAVGHFRRLDLTDFYAPFKLTITRDPLNGQNSALLIVRSARSNTNPTSLPSHSQMLDQLPSGEVLQELLRRAVDRAHARGALSIMCVNIARFAQINDTLGNSIGDAFIHGVATRLRQCIPNHQIVGRLAGDEFIVILQDIAAPEEIEGMGECIRAAMTLPIHVGDYEIHRDVYIGIAHFPGAGIDADTLLFNAHKAMASAKSNRGQSNVATFEPHLGAEAINRLLLETDLRHAIERQQLFVEYQPLVRTRDQKPLGFEALIRWKHHSLGLIPPEQLIAIAEDIGLIGQIGEWVLHTVCQQYSAWKADGWMPEKFGIAVNVSARQLDFPRFIPGVKQILMETGMDPRCLEFELTESCLMSDVDHATAVFEELHALGISISVDDFGTGYSSLSHLRNLPIDTLKIDRSFIRDVPDDHNDSAIARATIALAHNLGLKVIAEGVEHENQLRFLELNDCDQMQGFFFSKPMPASACQQFVTKANPRKCA